MFPFPRKCNEDKKCECRLLNIESFSDLDCMSKLLITYKSAYGNNIDDIALCPFQRHGLRQFMGISVAPTTLNKKKEEEKKTTVTKTTAVISSQRQYLYPLSDTVLVVGVIHLVRLLFTREDLRRLHNNICMLEITEDMNVGYLECWKSQHRTSIPRDKSFRTLADMKASLAAKKQA